MTRGREKQKQGGEEEDGKRQSRVEEENEAEREERSELLWDYCCMQRS